MAINLTDFDKIWASSSPLTPYSFSDANYEEGWNFVGSTPPARQMWDGYMKWSDEKQQYIVQNFLPLAGGTITGSVGTVGADNRKFYIIHDNNTVYPNYDNIDVGWSFTDGDGACISLRSASFGGASAGEFSVHAKNGSTTKTLKGKTDGTLTWDEKSIPARSFGTVIQGNGTYTFDCNESGAVIFAKRGTACSVHMVSYWDAGSVKIFETGTTITITKSANSNSVTITNSTTIGMVVKIINGDTL